MTHFYNNRFNLNKQAASFLCTGIAMSSSSSESHWVWARPGVIQSRRAWLCGPPDPLPAVARRWRRRRRRWWRCDLEPSGAARRGPRPAVSGERHAAHTSAPSRPDWRRLPWPVCSDLDRRRPAQLARNCAARFARLS